MGWLFYYDPIDCVYNCIYNHEIVINYYWRLLMDRLWLSILLSTMILYEYYYYCLLLYIYIFVDYDSGDWLVLLKIMYIHVFFKETYCLTIIILTMLWLTIDAVPIIDPMFSQERTLSAAASSLFVLEEHWKAKAWQDTARQWGDVVFMLMA